MTRNRFLTGSLASIAVASAITLAAPSAQAADRGCGQPAVEAVYSSVVHAPVFRTVPAQTHDEWTWERDVDDYVYEFSRELPGPTEYLFSRTVIDSPAVPAVPGTPEVSHTETVVTTPAVVVTEAEYLHEVTGKTRWEDPEWGAQNGGGNGWTKTGNVRETVVTPAVTTEITVVDSPAVPETPAVPEVSHLESQWALVAPGADWTGPQDSRVLGTIVDTVWAEIAPDGYDPTGASTVTGTHHEVTDVPTANAPDGAGWTQVADSVRTVVDVDAVEELVTDGFVEQVLLTPALPATDPCVEPPAEEPTTGGNAAGPQAAPAVEVSTSVATVLPNTGNDIPPWMAPAGLMAMLAGMAMIRFGRRHGLG